MAIPDYQTLMLPVLKHAAQGEMRIADIEEKIADEKGLSQAERKQLLTSGTQRILYSRISWAKAFLYYAGLLASPSRGRFKASEAGLKLLATKPDKIDVPLLLRTYPEFESWYRQREKSDDGPIATPPPEPASRTTPEDDIDVAQATMQAALREELLKRTLENSPAFFEGLILDLLLAMGYGGARRAAATQLGRTGDGGVDGVIDEDKLGLDRIYIQAKRYSTGTVGAGEVQAFVGALLQHGAMKGVFVTTSRFSPQAVKAVSTLQQRVILIDGHRLVDLMIEHNIGVRLNRTVELKRLDEDFFSEDD